jgi:hypothetical protein
MTDIPSIEIRQCHSYNRAGERCEHPAGHTGKHYISMTWSDAEAWTPTPARTGPLKPEEIRDTPIIVEEPVGPMRCGICEHPHHPKTCRVKVEMDDECGCTSSVPEPA